MMIKVCGITNLEDAVAAVEAGASALGFNFYLGSPRYVAPEIAASIAACLPAHVIKVGVFVNESEDVAGMDVAQLHGDSAAPAMRYWRAVRFSGALPNDDNAEAFLLDTPSAHLHGGTGETFDWTRAYGLPGKIILAGGLDGTNVRTAIQQARPWGVDACSRIESAPGKKDLEKMKRFIQTALETET